MTAPLRSPPPSPEPVLVADDDPALLQMMARGLEGGGFRVAVAPDGQRALEAWRAGRHFAALVLDIRMPGLDGVRVLEEVRRADREVPVILVTGDPDVDSARRALAAGAWDYLLKPFTVEDLLGRVNHAVEAVRLRRENERQARELEARYARMVVLERRRDELMNLLVGEMAEPLADLGLELELLADGLAGPLTAEQSRVLESARAGVERLVRIARDLADLKLIQEGHISWFKTAVPVRPVLEQAAGRVRRLTRTAAGPVGVTAAPELEWVGDESHLGRCVTGLLWGAIETAPDGAPVELAARAAGDGLLVEVTSPSARVPADVWQGAFEGADHRRLSATGLSAPACLALAVLGGLSRALGGEVRADVSDRTVFRLRLPVLQA